MKQEKLHNHETIDAIGYGTWNVGGRMQADYTADARAVAGIRAALEEGYTHIDTAEMYAAGHTEELIAQAILEAGAPRRKLFLTSKVWQSNLRYDAVLRSCENSLRRLETDYLDMYLIHWPGSTPLEETFQALNQLHASGQVRHIGVSNFDLELLKRAQELCDSPIATNQVPFSLHTRTYQENGVLAHCLENDILLTAYTPVERGKLGRDRRLQQIAADHNATPVQIALAWLVQLPGVIAIPMSLNPVHIRENYQAAAIELSVQEMELLNQG